MIFWLQNSALIQPRTSPLKFDDLARRKVRYRTFQLRSTVDALNAGDEAVVASVTTSVEAELAAAGVEVEFTGVASEEVRALLAS